MKPYFCPTKTRNSLLYGTGPFSNKIQAADDFFSSTYPNLLNLNMKENKIEQITQINCPFLTELNLSKNRLESVPILNTPKLKRLFLVQNRLIQASALQNNNFTLDHLDLKSNSLKSVPKINPSKLQFLDISRSYITDFSHFSQLQFPRIKELLIISQYNCYQNQIYAKIKLPQFKMPDLQVLNLQWTCFDDLSQFFEGTYSNMTHFDMGICKTCKKLPKLSMPNLQMLFIGCTLVQDLTNFSQGHYPKLAKLQWPHQIIFMKGKGPHSTLQQLCLQTTKPQRIISTNFPSDSKFFINNRNINLTHLNIDLMMVQISEFLSFLNLSLTKALSFQKCSNVNGLMKNLCKINFQQLPILVSIKIQQTSKANQLGMIKFFYAPQWQDFKHLFIRLDEGWRRAFRQNNPLEWCISSINGETRFDLLLTGMRHKLILGKIAKI